MFTVMTTKHFDKRLAGLPLPLQKRVVSKIIEVAKNPYAPNNNVKKLQGTTGYRLRVGDWRIIYEIKDEQLVMLVLEIDSRGGIYK